MAEDSSFYILGDEDFGNMAAAKPRRVPRKGKADIGGRIRVAKILKDAGLTTQGLPERIAGATNEVWRAGKYIIRVGFGKNDYRLRREAQLAQLLPMDVGYPNVIASGEGGFGEWIIVEYLSGTTTLSEAWNYMDEPQRQAAVHDVARSVKAVHSLELTSAQKEELEWKPDETPVPHQLPASRVIELLEQCIGMRYVDPGLISDAMDLTNQIKDSVSNHERFGLVHGDLHFENVLTRGAQVTSVIDFEWCRPGPTEIDIDTLARFCTNPEMHIGGDYPIYGSDFRNVIRWWGEVYPEMFDGDAMHERLTLCALSLEVPALLKFPPTGPMHTLPEFHPLNSLRELLTSGSHAERLGWVQDPFKI